MGLRIGQAQLALVRAHQGRAEEAEALAREAARAFEGTDFLIFRGQTLVALAGVLRALGRADEASQVAREAIRLFEGKGAAALADHARRALSWSQG